jgi:hypothetical protein
VVAGVDGFPVLECGQLMFKLYRPPGSNVFACRQCHNLTYRCVQEHDKRLDWLVKAPDWLLMDLMEPANVRGVCSRSELVT